MGWTFTRRFKGTSNLDWFRKEFDHEHTGEDGTIHSTKLLDGATVGGTFYGAVETLCGTVRTVWAVVCLTKWVPNSYPYNFGYKDMDESMDPGESNCPTKILDLLTPIPGVEETEPDTCARYAAEWRQRCRNRAEKRSPLQNGQIRRINGSLWLTSGKHDTVIVYKAKTYRGGTQTVVFSAHNGNRIRLSPSILAEVREAVVIGERKHPESGYVKSDEYVEWPERRLAA